MTPALPSTKLTNIYRSLPLEAQHVLVEKHLAQLLDLLPKYKANKVVSSANRLKERYDRVPTLDLKAKKKELSTLIDELRKDSKRSFVKDFSDKDDILDEAVESLIDWANKIWSVVYEHKVDFQHAHACLMFAIEVQGEISDARGGCKCSFMNMFITAAIKNKRGKAVKSFSFTGAQNLENVLLWVWRDLFVSLLATDERRGREITLEMLADLEGVLGWESLERLLYGGKIEPAHYNINDDDDDDDEDEDEDEDEEFSDDSDDYDSTGHYRRHFRAYYWPEDVACQRSQLRELVLERLTSVFKVTPSVNLFSTLITIDPDEDMASDNLYDILSSIATNSPENFAAALDIHTLEHNYEEIVELLDSHSHLLRPRDAQTFQSAITVLSTDSSSLSHCHEIVEKELFETIRTISAALSSCFCHIDEDEHQEEMTNILKLQHGSTTRHDRVERWVDAVVTPGINPPHPMAFAAMMMGFPVGPGMEDSEDADPLGYLDFDPSDSDLEDLRDEFRPKLKEWFEGWNETALSMRGGGPMLLKVYAKLVELMPFLRAPDAVDEMISRLSDKPSKLHICEALEALSAFCKLQRKQVIARVEKKRRMESQKKAQAKSHNTLPSGTTGSNTDTATPSSNTWHINAGALDDVD